MENGVFMEAKTEIYWLLESSLMQSVVIVNHKQLAPCLQPPAVRSSVSKLVGPPLCLERDKNKKYESEAKTQTVVAHKWAYR